MKMNDRNAQLRSALGGMPTKERIVESNNIPSEDTVNRQGFKAYSLPDELRLLAMLNTLKLEPQYYRSESETMRELRDLVERIGLRDPYFLCQCIVYSRCLGEGMRSINHLAAALAAPFVAGQPYAKAFYGLFDKKNKQGGCIYRPDDMREIKDVFASLNKSPLTNAMKKGFASVIEKLDGYQLSKYKSTIIDISNLSRPNSSKSKATVTINGEEMKVLDALMRGITVSADTWEVAQSEAGQEVAAAVKAGKIDKDEAKKILADAKNDNWESLLMDGKLGILAALRNIRNIMETPRKTVIDKLCNLLSNGELIRKGKIMPYQIDTAVEVIREELTYNTYTPQVLMALQNGYLASIPNLAAALPGKTCVMIDCSGSMQTPCTKNGKAMKNATACKKAGLLAATIAQATNADVVRFGSSAEYVSYNPATDVFRLAEVFSYANMGGTSISSAFELIRKSRKAYDRIILLSDNECNRRGGYYGDWTKDAYAKYVHDIASPYVYCIDLAAYGTTALKNDGKVNYYYGYGYAMFDDIASKEFNPEMHIEKVRKVVVDPNYNIAA